MAKKEYEDEQTKAFLKSLSDKHGGEPVTWKTFCLWYGDTNGNIREYGVFLYQIGINFYFEDFEREDSILGIKIKPRNKAEYVKFEGSISPTEVRFMQNVKKKDAEAYCKGKKETIRSVSPLGSLLNECVVQVQMDDKTSYFFQVPDTQFKQLMDMALAKYKWSKTIYDKENNK